MRLITCPWCAQSCQHQRLRSSSSIKDSDIVCQKAHNSTFQWKPTFGLADWGGGSGVGETLSPCCQKWTCIRAGSWVRGCAGQCLASSQKNKKTNKNKTELYWDPKPDGGLAPHHSQPPLYFEGIPLFGFLGEVCHLSNSLYSCWDLSSSCILWVWSLNLKIEENDHSPGPQL